MQDILKSLPVAQILLIAANVIFYAAAFLLIAALIGHEQNLVR